MKTLLKRLLTWLPAHTAAALRDRYRQGRDTVKVWMAGAHDTRWFNRHSGLHRSSRQRVLQARIIRSYHQIEKGLALPTPRPGFGADAISLLIEDLDAYMRQFSRDPVVQRGLDTLAEYLDFNQRIGNDVPAARRLMAHMQLASAEGKPAEGGTREVTRESILRNARLDLHDFFHSRHSVRQFSAAPVDEAMIEHAVRMAQRSPSVCNREAGRVFLASGRGRIDQLLAFQNGNRGFGQQVDKLLVVTTSLDCFLTVGERYQCWIDGGLFAMSLIYALHAQGLGTCCLNWSVEPEVDVAFKGSADIPPDQAVIMLLAVGHLPERFRVAMSTRRPLGEVLSRI